MGKIAVKIVTAAPTQGVSGGLADYRMLRPFKADIVLFPDNITGANVSGGVLPITQAEYDRVVA
jgi:hypothetical protein